MRGRTAAPRRSTRAPEPFGPPNLWALNDTRSGRCGRRGRVQPRDGLHGVGVEDGAGRPLPHHGRHRVEGLDGAELVVDGHHRHQDDVGRARLGQGVEVDEAPRVARDLAEFGPGAGGEGPARLEDGVVLEGRAHHRAGGAGGPSGGRRVPSPLDGEVVGLGATRRQDDVARPGPEQLGDAVAGVVEGGPDPARLGVGAGRVGEPFGQERQHRLQGLGPQRRGGGVVEVGAPTGPPGVRRHTCPVTRTAVGPSGDPDRLHVAEFVEPV